MRKLELLAPAKNLQCGIAAIDCGADAVYIGAPRFGARAAAGNSIEDIATLTEYAHRFGAKVYVTLNTIVYDDELNEAQTTLAEVNRIGVDAVLIQDMAVKRFYDDLASHADVTLALHASTQTDNRNKDKVGWLHSVGFSRVVLARELSLDEIKEIHEANPDVELEAFVHGALCVSYSGACYASHHCFGRSANRGECAQFCRMKFDLIDADGKEIEHQRHLLSLKDMCQIDRLEQLADAGVVSFKIEGRLKDISYVKNVVSAYSQRLDKLCETRNNEYQRASYGKVTYAFEPNLRKTFNRGYTHYFLDGRQPDIFSPDTPKAIGEYVGKVKEIRGKSFNVAGTSSFANGDGLCFINQSKELEGFRVNRAEGNRLYPLTLPSGLRPGIALYRNNDEAFEKELARPGTERKLQLNLYFYATECGFGLKGEGKGLVSSEVTVAFEHQKAQKPQRENIIRQLSKWGGTIYTLNDIEIEDGADEWFIPSSVISSLRQQLCDVLTTVTPKRTEIKTQGCPSKAVDEQKAHISNIANHVAQDYYDSLGMQVSKALEVLPVSQNPLLMQCRHCLRYSLGCCIKRGGRKPMWREPLSLRLGDGREFQLQFDCANCQMNVYAK